eukprot:12721736-Alexandrium_andersonii.AAC.1
MNSERPDDQSSRLDSCPPAAKNRADCEAECTMSRCRDVATSHFRAFVLSRVRAFAHSRVRDVA